MLNVPCNNCCHSEPIRVWHWSNTWLAPSSSFPMYCKLSFGTKQIAFERVVFSLSNLPIRIPDCVPFLQFSARSLVILHPHLFADQLRLERLPKLILLRNSHCLVGLCTKFINFQIDWSYLRKCPVPLNIVSPFFVFFHDPIHRESYPIVQA